MGAPLIYYKTKLQLSDFAYALLQDFTGDIHSVGFVASIASRDIEVVCTDVAHTPVPAHASLSGCYEVFHVDRGKVCLLLAFEGQ